ncbi:MAG: GLUG motif-containing protein [Candidatus Neomarinimicrobiota bacterium]
MKNFTTVLSTMLLLLIMSSALIAGTYSGGSGTEESPYEISGTNDLIELSNAPDDWEKYFKQTADIAFNVDESQVDWDGDGEANWDSNDTLGFSPIGKGWATWVGDDTLDTFFTGFYDGGGYTIDNMFIAGNSKMYIGLFGVSMDATIKDLGLRDLNITGDIFVGGLVGYIWTSTITNCYSTGQMSGTEFVGGLVGYNFESAITNCYSTGQMSGTKIIGGLVGYNDRNSTVNNCYSTGDVSGTIQVGGFLGYSNSSTIRNCYNMGSVTRSSGTGTSLAGFCGYSANDTIENSYSTGSVSYTGDTDPTDKGFVGEEYRDGSFGSNFFDSGASNQSTSTGASAKTTAEMKTESTFTDAGWDFIGESTNGTDDIWKIDNDNNDGYPYFDWQVFIEKESPEIIKLILVSDIDTASVKASAEITSLGNPSIVEHGFVWAQNGDFKNLSDQVLLGTKNAVGTFSKELADLSVNTSYDIFAFATNHRDTVFTDTSSFRTLGLARISTVSVAEINSGSATVNADIISLGHPNPTQHGFCWATTELPGIEDSKIELGVADSTGNFSSTINDLLPNTRYYIRAFVKNDVGTAYSEEVSFNTLETSINSLPAEFSIKQNYPNPFNPTTTIEFSLPVQSDVTCSIYNVKGYLVKEYSYEQNAGTHRIIWDASNVSSGIYLIRFIAEASDGSETFVDYQKVTLLK